MRYTTHAANMVDIPNLGEQISSVLAKSLSGSDRKLIESLKSYFDKKNGLTTKQYDLLLSISNRYSDENIKKTKDWQESFDADKRARMNLAAEYYSTTPYFGDLVFRIKANPEFVPSEKQYNSMCHNKYFENALKNYNANPAFDLGDLVVFRDNGRNYHRDKSIIGLIEEVNEKKSFEKGGRMYTMMILGTEDNLKVTESDIKMYREKKSSNV